MLPQGGARDHALDNLRASLVALVVLHHTAIVYRGSGGLSFRSQCFLATSEVLVTFNAINQSCFMALFFLLSGHFTRVQMRKQRTSRWRVLRTRLLRILLPAVLYTLLIEPSVDAMVWAWKGGPQHGTAGALYVAYWKSLRGFRGPVWYLALVMVFDAISVLLLWSWMTTPVKQLKTFFARHGKMIKSTIWLVTITTDWAIRLAYPVGCTWSPMDLQLAYVSQYVLAYCGGYLSVMADSLFVLLPYKYTLHKSSRKFAAALTVCLSTLGLSTLVEAKALHISVKEISEQTRGGINVPAAVYAVWNEMGFALIGFAVVALFAEHYDRRWMVKSAWIPRYSYAVYLLHPLVSTGVELGVEALMSCRNGDDRNLHTGWLAVGAVVLAIVVGAVNVVASWFVAFVFVSFVPFVGRVI